MLALVQGGVSTWKRTGSATIKPPAQQHSRPNASGEHRNHTSGPSPTSRLPPPSALFPHRQRPASAASSFRGLSTWTATPRRLASRRDPRRKTFRKADGWHCGMAIAACLGKRTTAEAAAITQHGSRDGRECLTSVACTSFCHRQRPWHRVHLYGDPLMMSRGSDWHPWESPICIEHAVQSRGIQKSDLIKPHQHVAM